MVHPVLNDELGTHGGTGRKGVVVQCAIMSPCSPSRLTANLRELRKWGNVLQRMQELDMAIPEPHFLWKIMRTIVQGILQDHPDLKGDLDTIMPGRRMGISVTLEGVKEMHKLLAKWMERWSKEELTEGTASKGKTRAKGKGGLKGKEESSLTPDKKGKGPGSQEEEDEVTRKGTETTVCKFFMTLRVSKR